MEKECSSFGRRKQKPTSSGNWGVMHLKKYDGYITGAEAPNPLLCGASVDGK
jgi:hypothetical protein